MMPPRSHLSRQRTFVGSSLGSRGNPTGHDAPMRDAPITVVDAVDALFRRHGDMSLRLLVTLAPAAASTRTLQRHLTAYRRYGEGWVHEARAASAKGNRERSRRPERRENCRRARRARYNDDPTFRLGLLLRTRLWKALKGIAKSASTMELLGCPVEFLRLRLELMFHDGMSWENMGEWHVDHIIPCADFDLSDPAQQRKCFHWSNMQPLWGQKNLSKGARRDETFPIRMIVPT